MYGARISGSSGTETYYFEKHSDAVRARRVVRAYRAQGGFTGAQTLIELLKLATRSKGLHTNTILDLFAAGRK